MEKYHCHFGIKNTYKELSTEIPKGQLDRLANHASDNWSPSRSVSLSEMLKCKCI